MSQSIIAEIAPAVLAAKGPQPLRVGIDGIDAAGKTCLADALAAHLSGLGCQVLRASIDGFHNPRDIRYRRGGRSPEGYYYDSFNYPQLIDGLLAPLAPHGSRRCRLRAYDFNNDFRHPRIVSAGR